MQPNLEKNQRNDPTVFRCASREHSQKDEIRPETVQVDRMCVSGFHRLQYSGKARNDAVEFGPKLSGCWRRNH